MRLPFGILYLLLACLSIAQTVPSSGCSLKSPLPHGVVCGTAGHNATYQTTKSLPSGNNFRQLVTSLTECRDLCLRRPAPTENFYNSYVDITCSSFKFNHSSLLCTFTPLPLLSITEDSSSDIVFYNRSCFDCPPACPQQPGVNLLDNGGFELSRHRFAPWSADSGLKIVDGGSNSSRAASCSVAHCDPSETCTCNLYTDFQICPNTIYEWSFDYRAAPRGNDTLTMGAVFDSSTLEIFIPRGGTAKTWNTFTNLAESIGQSFGSFLLTNPFGYAMKNGILELDNIKVVPTTYKYESVDGAPNVLSNGGFETGSTSPWVINLDGDDLEATVVSPGINSAHGLNFSLGPGASISYLDYGTITLTQNTSHQAPLLTPGTPYLASVDYISNAIESFALNVFFNIYPYDTSRHLKPPKDLKGLTQVYYGDTMGIEKYGPAGVDLNASGTIFFPFIGQPNIYFVQYFFIVEASTPVDAGLWVIFDNFAIKQLASSS